MYMNSMSRRRHTVPTRRRPSRRRVVRRGRPRYVRRPRIFRTTGADADGDGDAVQ